MYYDMSTTQPQQREDPQAAAGRALCPACGEPMRREYDGVRNPPMPHVFWFCTNSDCPEGKENLLFHGG